MTPLMLALLLFAAISKKTTDSPRRATGLRPEPLPYRPLPPSPAPTPAAPPPRPVVVPIPRGPAPVPAAALPPKSAPVAPQVKQQIRKAAAAPAPWPQQIPKDLPPFPAGWEPDIPPPSAVTTRAWQLLPVLWKKGQGAIQVETIKGRWITFQAQMHPGNKRGVTAYRVRGTSAAS